MSQIRSTGRGGAGNIGEDANEYTDGSIIREGPAGQSGGGGEFSTGRGGAGNIGDSPRIKPQQRLDDEIVPETATRQDPRGDYADFHTGRGGQGNIHKDKFGGHSTKKEQEEADQRAAQRGMDRNDSFGDKVKKALGLEK